MTASSIHVVKTRIVEGACFVTFTPHGVLDALTLQLFNNFNCNLFEKEMQLPKQMVIAYITRDLRHGWPSPSPFLVTSMRIPESKNLATTLITVNYASCETLNRTIRRDAQQANIHDKNEANNLIEAILHSPLVDRKLRCIEHVTIKTESTAQLTKEWKEDVAKYMQYRASELFYQCVEILVYVIQPPRSH